MDKRRKFIKQSLLLGTALGSINFLSSCENTLNKKENELSEKLNIEPKAKPKEHLQIQKNSVILFQGDSITDGGRSREALKANDAWGFGTGYANYAATKLLGENPEKNIQIYNRGVSGHKVFELANRWQEDCIDLKPDVLSVLIGVNDYWHTMTHDYKGTIETYLTDFNALLEQTKKSFPNISLIIGEPFFVKGGTAIQESWHDKLTPYRVAAKAVADQHEAIFIPYQEIFNDALKIAPVSYWAADGVHPSMSGSYLMGEAWLKALKSI